MAAGSLQSIYEEMLAGATVDIPVGNKEEHATLLQRLRVIKSRYDAKTEAMFGGRVSEGKIIHAETVKKVGYDDLIFVRLKLKQPNTPRYSYKIIDVSPTPDTPT